MSDVWLRGLQFNATLAKSDVKYTMHVLSCNVLLNYNRASLSWNFF